MEKNSTPGKGSNSQEKFKFNLDGKNVDWERSYITGAELRNTGQLPPTTEIYLKSKGNKSDELITDDRQVDLSPNGTDHFYSKDKGKKVKLIVNGSSKDWDQDKISFKEVIILAYGNYVDSPTMVYTVGYEDGPKENPEGSMIKDSSVFVKNKMIFHATATDKS